jgi:hypothetical protein
MIFADALGFVVGGFRPD